MFGSIQASFQNTELWPTLIQDKQTLAKTQLLLPKFVRRTWKQPMNQCWQAKAMSHSYLPFTHNQLYTLHTCNLQTIRYEERNRGNSKMYLQCPSSSY